MSGGVFIVTPEQTVISYPAAEVINANLSRARPHMRSILRAVRDEGCDQLVVAQRSGSFSELIGESPTIVIIGDDMETSLGPDGFNKKSLRKAAKAATVAAVMVGLSEDAYHEAVSWAVLKRVNVLIVETRTAHDMIWVHYLREINPALGVLLVGDRSEAPAQ